MQGSEWSEQDRAGPAVWSKVKSSPMVEIRQTGWSGLADQTWSGPVGPGLPSNRICTAL